MNSKIENWARESAQRKLETEVRLMNPEQREKYLERVANLYLRELSEKSNIIKY